jgi:prolyl-tRNA synthetase
MTKGITKRKDDYSQWYTDIVIKAEMADYSPVRGCMVIRPHGFEVWEHLRDEIDRRIKSCGVGGKLHKNAYFPLFIPESFLKREAEHVKGFVPQCAVVTEGGGSVLEEKLYLRPTSETIMYDMYSKWISSWRDLPLLINQWANIVRWELRTRLFLRTLEFLWQEGHTAHATHEEAYEETQMILNNIYTRVAEDFMAIPVLRGKKTPSQRFPGAVETYCIEGLMQDNKALQMGTSHDLGQNFAKPFNIRFQDKDGSLKYVYQTSWGVSTRLIGALIMAHSDDSGLVLPPLLAPVQVIIVPIYKSDSERASTIKAARKIANSLQDEEIRVETDEREEYKPGFKFHDWELRGVPVRIELGPREIEDSNAVLARRDTGEKQTVSQKGLPHTIRDLLAAIQKNLYERALKFQKDNTAETNDYEEFKKIMEERGGFVWSPWCERPECEDKLQEDTKATIRMIPLDSEVKEGKCIVCGAPSKIRVPFAKAY